MYIPDHAIKGLHDSTRPLVIYRHKDGTFKCGLVMRCDEFITTFALLQEVNRMAGLLIVDAYGNPI